MPDNLDFTITAVTLASSEGQLIVDRNPKRSYLAIQNTGTGAASFTLSTAASTTAGLGISLDPASGAGGQGGSWEWTKAVPTNPVYGYSASGTTCIVIEG